MALGDAHRASGQAMEQARRASGQAMEDARRNAGRQMEASRRGEAVVEDINSIVQPRRLRSSLPRLQPVGAIPAQRSRADYKPPASSGTGGLTGPLTEVENSRQYFAEKTLFYTADSLFAFEVQPLRQLMTVDGEENALPINFKAPPTNV